MEEALSPEIAEADVEDVRTIGRKGTGRGRIEVLARERRRSWTPEQKRAIVAESLGPELTPSEVARKYAISSGLLYSWRQQVLGGQAHVVSRSAPSFARVELAPVLQSLAGSEPVAPTVPGSLPATRSGPDGLIEIVLPSGVLVRVDAAVDGRALRRVLGALDGR
ncbi:MAG: transposase [Rouxiella badensis]|jgi:transposase|uniref:IS66-like element accessory protein TnpA n=1 Tax=Rouxiella badensis TaxID=1646377 RepID=UPI003C47C0F0